MNPLQKLKKFKTPGAPTPSQPTSFTYKGETYDTPNEWTQAIPGYENTTRAKAYKAYLAELSARVGKPDHAPCTPGNTRKDVR